MGQGRPTNEPTNYFAVGKQSAKDTEATTFTFLRHLDGTALETVEEIQSDREGGDGQEVGLRYKTAISMDGQAVVNDRPEIGARLFAWALGAETITASFPPGFATTASGVANEHLALPTSAIPYLTLEQFWADQVERVPNAQITGLDIEGEQGRPLKITAQFVGGGSPYSPTAAQSPTRETGPPFIFPGGSYVLNGAANTKLTKFKASIKRNVDDGIRTTGLGREDVVALNFDVDFECTLKFEDSGTSLYDLTHYGASGGSQIPVDLATTAFKAYTQFGSGTNARYFEFGLPQLQLTGARVNKLDPDGKTMYADVSMSGIKGATNQVYAKTVIGSIAAV